MKKKVTYDKKGLSRDKNIYPVDYQRIKDTTKSLENTERNIIFDETGQYLVVKKE